uniref:hypothetical protein n=1 Tax=Paraburkholderia solitsugae TaxID=2675748 RepID=UPI001F2F615B
MRVAHRYAPPLLLYLERPDLPGSEQQPFEFAFDLGAQGWQQLCGVLRPPVRPRAATDSLGPQVVEYQQRADAVAMGSALLPQAIEFTVYPPLIFLFGGGDTC